MIRLGFLCLVVLMTTAALGQSPSAIPIPRGPSLVGQPSPPPEVPPRAKTLPAPDLQAIPALGITLEEAEATAMANNPSLARAAARVGVARGRWVQAGLYPNPQFGYVGSEMGNDGRGGQQGGLISQQFVTGGKLRLNREVAGREVAVAEQDFAAQRLRVLTDVRVGYFELLVSQTRAEIAQRLVAISQRGLQIAEGLFKGKEVAQADVLRAGVELEMARIELQKSAFARDANWRSLVALMGTPDVPCGRAAGPLEMNWPTYEWCGALQRLLSQSPEMSAALIRVERARWALGRARVEPVPDLNVQASVQRDDVTRDTIFGAQATIALPLFNRNQGNIAAAQSELFAAQRDADRVALGLQQRLAPAFQAYQASRAEVDRYDRNIVPSTEKILEQVTAGYRQSEFSYIDMLSAQRTFFQARLSHLEALRQLRGAMARIDGMLLSDSLKD